MIVGAYNGRTVAVVGLGKSGLAAARALTAGGATVLAWDDNEARRAEAERAGFTVCDPVSIGGATLAALVLSPGIPLTHPAPHPAVAWARAAKVPVIGDIELFACAKGAARVVGVTGTNGKSTTTTLIGHILETIGAEVAVGGNLGTPALDLPALEPAGVYVLELSSYQLDLVESLRLDVAVFLNLSPDHIDRHGDMAGYVTAKQRIFRNQGSDQTAIVGRDDPDSERVYAALVAEQRQAVVGIAATRALASGVFATDGVVRDTATPGASATLIGIQSLLGLHNWQNAAAAVAAVRVLGFPFAAIAAALPRFAGLAHRMELIATIDRVRYVNDSKATNADAAARALASFDDIYWIAGGLAKAGGIAALGPYFAKIAHAFLIGRAADEFARTLDGHVPYTKAGTLEAALEAARRAAAADRRANPVVLLSPACASFDQFANFEARGERFRALVQALRPAGSAARPTACVA
ncbi:MAG: UDP-N-acetylmuramoyl-L-alanine--D-glutamate ligase [Alphaproteobacteria bacterium]|nr:UDP-N-acetylmuramoyl-L-alanine--D-glutamate ligase [Alphaproteobacteria bacterium]